PPLLGGAASPQPVTPKKRLPAKQDIVISKDPPKPTQAEEAPAPLRSDTGAGPPDGQPEGKPWGVSSGTPGATGTARPPPAPTPPPPVTAVLPFGEGMNRPTLVSGPKPVYSREAREARVEGTMLVKCVITTAGTLRSCRVLKSLPFMEQAVLSALASQRYTPV